MADKPTEEDFRAIGFTSAAGSFPRDDLAVHMIAAFNGVTPDKLPSPAWHYFPNAATAKAWGRVAEAARAYLEKEARSALSEGQ